MIFINKLYYVHHSPSYVKVYWEKEILCAICFARADCNITLHLVVGTYNFTIYNYYCCWLKRVCCAF